MHAGDIERAIELNESEKAVFRLQDGGRGGRLTFYLISG